MDGGGVYGSVWLSYQENEEEEEEEKRTLTALFRKHI